MFEAFLSATQFGELEWKLQALRAAEELALLTPDHVNLARVTFRHWNLRRLHPMPIAANSRLPFSLPPFQRLRASDQRANAFLGQRVLIEAQDLIDKSESPTEVRKAISNFRPYKVDDASFQESLVLLECHFLYAKSLRFNGDFDAAVQELRKVLRTAEGLNSRLTLKIVLQFAEVECERGYHSRALDELEDDKNYVGEKQRLELGSETLTRQGIWITKQYQSARHCLPGFVILMQALGRLDFWQDRVLSKFAVDWLQSTTSVDRIRLRSSCGKRPKLLQNVVGRSQDILSS
ncbi:hypothetical protein CABS02_13369 [Colletotrichum abscissum]|uniref:Uncharacterized protein n=1 Tax=Colletotrichum abscissum TaxID=1671311 RepID=A0A9P9X2Z7_9PEZI|nr:hypothetical protein CABS02_13369 [Colletotrichum abscissum]